MRLKNTASSRSGTRSDGNQRLYSPEIVPRVRLIVEALDRGHRPRQVVGASSEQLCTLLGRTAHPPASTVGFERAAIRLSAQAVLISVSAAGADAAVEPLNALAERPPRGITLVLGGAGAPEVIGGAVRLHGLRDLATWLGAPL